MKFNVENSVGAPGFFPLGKSLHGSEVMGAYFVSNVQFCEVYYRYLYCKKWAADVVLSLIHI